MKTKTLSILIPAYNEGKTIHEILNKVKEVKLINDINKEIIVINDHSTDNTVDVVKNYMKNNSEMNIILYEQEFKIIQK